MFFGVHAGWREGMHNVPCRRVFNDALGRCACRRAAIGCKSFEMQQPSSRASTVSSHLQAVQQQSPASAATAVTCKLYNSSHLKALQQQSLASLSKHDSRHCRI